MAVRMTAERRQEIRRLILAGILPSMSDLAAQFNVSRETIRKDLLFLEKEGLGKKGYGGTFFVDSVRERALDLRLTENVDKKAAIAGAALRFIPAGSAIFLDAGSTTLELARVLQSKPDLHIITNSAAIPEFMADCPSTISCLGGDLRKTSLAFTGQWTLNAIEFVHADVAFLAADGIEEKGPCTSVYAEAEVKKAMAKNAYQRILLCDSTKLDKTSAVRFCEWSDIDTLITDSGISAAHAEALKKKVNLIIADKDQ